MHIVNDNLIFKLFIFTINIHNMQLRVQLFMIQSNIDIKELKIKLSNLRSLRLQCNHYFTIDHFSLF